MKEFVCFLAIFANLWALPMVASLQWTRILHAQPHFSLLRMAKGFGGAKPAGANAKKDGIEVIPKSQVRRIQKESPCLCGSGSTYENCCYKQHRTDALVTCCDPVTMTRARYTAYALGVPDYIIETSHRSNKDYQRHAGANRDPKKAYKAWLKEIVTKNSEVFDFLKFELVDEKFMENGDTVYPKPYHQVSYNIIAREKSSSALVAFQEVSVYVKDSPRMQEIRPEGSTIMPIEEETSDSRWYYASGTVAPMDEADVKKHLKNLPKYTARDTIRDRW
mmetsp:Transcript_2842/g.4351  ORF Transcript_2842/g.4351 Transcript_2842/m.4351 type:complete len:277 (+) Transcript_2842:49-879(+)